MNRQLLTLVLFLSVIGCKKSSPTSSATAAVSPTPVAQAQKTALASPTPAPQPTPVASFLVQPPASFSADQIPQDGLSEFTVKGNAGQYLRVEVDEEKNRRADRPTLAVQSPENGPQLAPITPDFCDDWTYAFPEAGTYRIVFNPAGRKTTVRFTLLESTDPLLVVGITPEQISLDFGPFAKGKTVEAQPYELTCEVGESWPAYVVAKSDKISLHIMQVAGYKELFRHDTSLLLLQASLQPDAKPVEAKNLPYASSDDAATVMSARPELLKGDGWRGWRWIEGQAQDGDYPAYLVYIFEGISDDERFLFRMTALISHPEHKRLFPKAGQSNDSWDKQETTNRLRLEKSLAAADPASFQPNLDQFDAVIRSLKLQH